jgi:hypothetical protein
MLLFDKLGIVPCEIISSLVPHGFFLGEIIPELVVVFWRVDSNKIVFPVAGSLPAEKKSPR